MGGLNTLTLSTALRDLHWPVFQPNPSSAGAILACYHSRNIKPDTARLQLGLAHLQPILNNFSSAS